MSMQMELDDELVEVLPESERPPTEVARELIKETIHSHQWSLTEGH